MIIETSSNLPQHGQVITFQKPPVGWPEACRIGASYRFERWSKLDGHDVHFVNIDTGARIHVRAKEANRSVWSLVA
jgi:hypothetical protein